MHNCGFTKENNWFRYRAAAIILENNCVLFAGYETADYYNRCFTSFTFLFLYTCKY